MARCTRFSVAAALLILALPSCSRDECDDHPEGLERDTCVFEQIQALGADDVGRVRVLAGTIEDSVVRSAAVDSWLRDHRATLTNEDGLALCDLLEPAAWGRCRRWFFAAHLHR